ncbi:CFEM domain-containing protein [Colletotrichum falcatum]|nr:CFEM domain-containing protein [Colletotrichum falcatum]
MRFSSAVLVVLLWCQGVWSLDKTIDTPAPSDIIPLCGMNCILQVTTATGLCPLSNMTCLCTNEQLNQQISLCVHSNCTVRDSLQVQRYSKHTCGAPSRDRTALVWIISTVFLALGLFAFFLRVLSKLLMRGQAWGHDDWVMVLAVAIMIPLNGLSYPISQVALGKDIWNVQPDDITQFLYIFYWDELLYLGALPATKISILLFYLKVFSKRGIRLGCWILIGLNGAWRGWDKEFPTRCSNLNVQSWVAAICNILLDLATLILPLKELYSLSLSVRKKIMVMMMFCVGFFVTIVSIVRLDSLATYATTDNVTQDYVEVGYWSTIEVPVGIICACMPAIYALFSVMFPKVFGTTQRGAKSNYANLSEQKNPASTPLKLTSKISGRAAIRVHKEFFIKSGRRGDVSYVDPEPVHPFRDPRPRSSRRMATKVTRLIESV